MPLDPTFYAFSTKDARGLNAANCFVRAYRLSGGEPVDAGLAAVTIGTWARLNAGNRSYAVNRDRLRFPAAAEAVTGVAGYTLAIAWPSTTGPTGGTTVDGRVARASPVDVGVGDRHEVPAQWLRIELQANGAITVDGLFRMFELGSLYRVFETGFVSLHTGSPVTSANELGSGSMVRASISAGAGLGLHEGNKPYVIRVDPPAPPHNVPRYVAGVRNWLRKELPLDVTGASGEANRFRGLGAGTPTHWGLWTDKTPGMGTLLMSAALGSVPTRPANGYWFTARGDAIAVTGTFPGYPDVPLLGPPGYLVELPQPG